PKYELEVSGCTAAVSVISKHKIWVANAGDSRSVLGVKGRAKPLSFDHKPQNEGEKARISAAGGFVDFGRVNGNLALSRALGDFEFKRSAELSPEQQIVTAYPDVTVHELCDDDEFLVIACDGIWDVQSSQSVVEFVRRGIAAKQDLHYICENMMNNCLASGSETGGVGCDNMTMVIIGLLNGRTKEQWYDQIAERVAQAEFRDRGNRRFAEAPDDYEVDLDRTREFGVRSGRIILLGDGTEVIPDQSEDEPFDQSEEEQEASSTTTNQEQAGSTGTTRNDREGTPGPQTQNESGTSNISESPAPAAEGQNNNGTTANSADGEAAGQKSGSS
ncbi:Protein phosphatase 2C 2, partial [Elasticomyces elasticus]